MEGYQQPLAAARTHDEEKWQLHCAVGEWSCVASSIECSEFSGQMHPRGCFTQINSQGFRRGPSP